MNKFLEETELVDFSHPDIQTLAYTLSNPSIVHESIPMDEYRRVSCQRRRFTP